MARPRSNPPRECRIPQQEIERICLALNWRHNAVGVVPETKQQRIALAFLFAIETAMRAGEICALSHYGKGLLRERSPGAKRVMASCLVSWKVSPSTPALCRATRNIAYSEAVVMSNPIHPDAATSSGSAILAESDQTSTLVSGQRKLTGFDMEVYSVFEAARHSLTKPAFFAAKSVVDDGSKNKGDAFHRIACLISARFVGKTLQNGIMDLRKAE